MSSLVVTIIAIVLVVVLAVASMYYGGSTYRAGQSAAASAALTNQAQQLYAAAQLYHQEKGAWPSSPDALLEDGLYLKSLPEPPSNAIIAKTTTLNPISTAYAADVGSVQWKFALDSKGTLAYIVLPNTVRDAACLGVNKEGDFDMPKKVEEAKVELSKVESGKGALAGSAPAKEVFTNKFVTSQFGIPNRDITLETSLQIGTNQSKELMAKALAVPLKVDPKKKYNCINEGLASGKTNDSYSYFWGVPTDANRCEALGNYSSMTGSSIECGESVSLTPSGESSNVATLITDPVDFGVVFKGANSIKVVNVTSLASTPITLSNITISGAAFSLVSETCSNKSFNLGDSCELQVRFSPTTGGAFSGDVTISIQSNGTTNEFSNKGSLNGEGKVQTSVVTLPKPTELGTDYTMAVDADSNYYAVARVNTPDPAVHKYAMDGTLLSVVVPKHFEPISIHSGMTPIELWFSGKTLAMYYSRYQSVGIITMNPDISYTGQPFSSGKDGGWDYKNWQVNDWRDSTRLLVDKQSVTVMDYASNTSYYFMRAGLNQATWTPYWVSYMFGAALGFDGTLYFCREDGFFQYKPGKSLIQLDSYSAGCAHGGLTIGGDNVPYVFKNNVIYKYDFASTAKNKWIAYTGKFKINATQDGTLSEATFSSGAQLKPHPGGKVYVVEDGAIRLIP